MSSSSRLSLAVLLFAAVLASKFVSAEQPAPKTTLKTTTHHPMAYHLSLPEHWVPGGHWPVVVILESANREFAKTAGLFSAARKDRPFILLTPLIVSGGGSGYRQVAEYPYSAATWDMIEKEGPFQFDDDGIQAMLADVRQLYGADNRYFLTGWEAGGHPLFALLFRHPEALQGVVAVTPNYLGRHLTPADFSTHPARSNLPVRILISGKLAADPAGHFIVTQSRNALTTALAHGYADSSLTLLPDQPHTPMAAQVLDIFTRLLSPGQVSDPIARP